MYETVHEESKMSRSVSDCMHTLMLGLVCAPLLSAALPSAPSGGLQTPPGASMLHDRHKWQFFNHTAVRARQLGFQTP